MVSLCHLSSRIFILCVLLNEGGFVPKTRAMCSSWGGEEREQDFSDLDISIIPSYRSGSSKAFTLSQELTKILMRKCWKSLRT